MDFPLADSFLDDFPDVNMRHRGVLPFVLHHGDQVVHLSGQVLVDVHSQVALDLGLGDLNIGLIQLFLFDLQEHVSD